MSLILLWNTIIPGGDDSGIIGRPPPPGGWIGAIKIYSKYAAAETTYVRFGQEQSIEHHNSSKKPVTYLYDSVIAPPATLLGNQRLCHFRVAGKPIALLGAWGTSHHPFSTRHKTGVWRVISTSSKLRVKGLPVVRISDPTTCGHAVAKAYPRLRSR
jgi:hypothetical protein